MFERFFFSICNIKKRPPSLDMNVYFSTNLLLLTEILVIIFKQTFCRNYTGLSVLAYVFTPDNSSRVHELIPKIQSFHVWLMSPIHAQRTKIMQTETMTCRQI